ncbi:hypothetical protein K488DRAFT_90367 [Vararia minispora EC-137]|uniref:Uncharacterized protein n=1 Tax=Vararia minispora EC-137 TaxID=1314806 RepID=A0ACB8Q7V6_9AGAM|nr:hypothetical protein K488DRAFT_90367 [Vararia minispora EC-137]
MSSTDSVYAPSLANPDNPAHADPPSPSPPPPYIPLMSYSPGKFLVQSRQLPCSSNATVPYLTLPSPAPPAHTRPPRRLYIYQPGPLPREKPGPRARWAARARHPNGLPSRTLHFFCAPIQHVNDTVTWRLKCRPPTPAPLHQSIPILFVTQTQPTYITLSDMRVVDPMTVSVRITVDNPRDDGDPELRRPMSGDRLLLPNETVHRPWHVSARQLLLWFSSSYPYSLFSLPPTRPLPALSCPAVAEAPYDTSAIHLPHSSNILESYDEHELEYDFLTHGNKDRPGNIYVFHEPPLYDPPIYPSLTSTSTV